MQQILVLPIKEDKYDKDTNELHLSIFVAYTLENEKIKLIHPIDINHKKEIGLNPVGFENFLPQNISNEDFQNVLKNMYVNTLEYENPFLTAGAINTFLFPKIEQMVAYPIALPENYYLSVLKVKLSLTTLEYDLSVFNVLDMTYLTTNNVITFEEIESLDKPDNAEKEILKEVGLKLKFSTFNKNIYEEIKALSDIYLISQPNIVFN